MLRGSCQLVTRKSGVSPACYEEVTIGASDSGFTIRQCAPYKFAYYYYYYYYEEAGDFQTISTCQDGLATSQTSS